MKEKADKGELNTGRNKNHPTARALIKWINRAISFAEALVLVLMLLFGVYAIWDNRRIDHENTASEYEMYKPTAADTRTYDDFRKINPDVCGWLTIDNTGVDYPLVQGKDNDEYMNTTPDRKFALSGSLFLDCQNQNNFSDSDTIIYGHHMEGPSMFGVLDRYTDSDFFKNHGDGLLYYGGQWHELEIFAFLEVDAYDPMIYRIASDAAEYQSYLDYVKSNARQYRDVEVTTSDRIIVMSTCMTDRTNGRYVVVGKIGQVTDGPQEQTTGRVFARDGLSPRTWNLIFAASGALVILIVILLYLRFRHRMREKERKAAVSTESTEEVIEETKAKKRSGKRKRTVWGDLLDLLIRIAIIAAVIWVIFHYVFGLFVNSGVGMEPSVQDRDIILYYRMDSDYAINEAVVYKAQGEERLGRVVAKGGDTVEITDEGLKVNGYLQQDYKDVGETLAVRGGTGYPVTLAEDEVFILGDNREKSTDSRMFGPVKLSEIRGSVMTVLRRRDV